MPTFGRYELGEELSRRGATVVAIAIRSASAGPTVVKVFQADQALLPSDQIASQAAAFLAAATTQQQVASSGSSHWAPIHDVGPVPDGAYYVTTQYRLSAQKLIRGKVQLPSANLFAIADGTIKGLRELKRACGRSHGNLKATNILLEAAERPSPVRIRLSDPASDADSCSEAGDLQALGAVLYELVTHQIAKGYASWPIPASAAWADLGRNGERWRELCNRLLNPSADTSSLTLDGVAYEVAALSLGPSSAKLIRRTALAASVAAAAMIGAFVIHYAVTRPSSVATRVAVASGPASSAPGPRLKEKRLGYNSKVVTNSIGMKLVAIKPGTFLMGSPEDEVGRQPDEHQHKVTLTKPFYIQATTVTQAQWKAIMGTTVAQQRDKLKGNPKLNPLFGEGDDYPMYYVFWDEAVEFCQKLSQKEGGHYRLPTEAEWEYACRAGTDGAYGGTGRLDDMGWCADNSGDKPLDSLQILQTDMNNYDKRVLANHCQSHPVGQKKPNAWGLYDMHGNVLQWCRDDDYAPYAGDATDPTGPRRSETSTHVLRGGSWYGNPPYCRAACRGWFAPDYRLYYIGFRVCLDLNNNEPDAQNADALRLDE